MYKLLHYTLAIIDTIHYDDAPNLYYTLKTMEKIPRYPQTTKKSILQIENNSLEVSEMVVYVKKYDIEILENLGDKCYVLCRGKKIQIDTKDIICE